MKCEMVLNAALRSRRISIDKRPESAASSRSLEIFRSAVSTLWWEQNPDWNCSYKLLQERWSRSWKATIFSRILDKNGKFEIGWKLSKFFESVPGFLRISVITAVLSAIGTVPERSEVWMRSVTEWFNDSCRHLLA